MGAAVPAPRRTFGGIGPGRWARRSMVSRDTLESFGPAQAVSALPGTGEGASARARRLRSKQPAAAPAPDRRAFGPTLRMRSSGPGCPGATRSQDRPGSAPRGRHGRAARGAGFGFAAAGGPSCRKAPRPRCRHGCGMPNAGSGALRAPRAGTRTIGGERFLSDPSCAAGERMPHRWRPLDPVAISRGAGPDDRRAQGAGGCGRICGPAATGRR